MLYKAKSKISGNGLFTDEKILKDEYIGTFKTVEAKYITKFSIVLKGEWRRAICILRFANHSKNPNVRVTPGLKMYAIKDIKPGTEICWHYGGDWE